MSAYRYIAKVRYVSIIYLLTCTGACYELCLSLDSSRCLHVKIGQDVQALGVNLKNIMQVVHGTDHLNIRRGVYFFPTEPDFFGNTHLILIR